MRLAAGDHYSMLLNDKGEIFSFGRGDHGQLGHMRRQFIGYRQYVPKKIEALRGLFIIAITCGVDHSMAISGTVAAFSLLQSLLIVKQIPGSCGYGARTTAANWGSRAANPALLRAHSTFPLSNVLEGGLLSHKPVWLRSRLEDLIRWRSPQLASSILGVHKLGVR